MGMPGHGKLLAEVDNILTPHTTARGPRGIRQRYHFFTLRVTLVVRVSVGVPPVPVMVRVKRPDGVDDVVVTVNVEEVPVVEEGLKPAVLLVGRPPTAKLTGATKPPVLVTVTL